MKLWWISFSLVIAPISAWGAACCGGSVSSSPLILGEEKARFGVSMSVAEIQIDSVSSEGTWYPASSNKSIRTYRVEANHLLTDRWQVGGRMELIHRQSTTESQSGWGDLNVSAAYEAVTDWDYDPLIPKVFFYGQLIVPTGPSRLETSGTGWDRMSHGFWAGGVGLTATQSWGSWDVLSNVEMRRSIEKSAIIQGRSGRLVPAWGGQYLVGGGYSRDRWRLGQSIIWNYEDPIEWRGEGTLPLGVERFATWNVQLSYQWQRQWTGLLTYSDQTVFGRPVNTSLARSIAIQLIHQWER